MNAPIETTTRKAGCLQGLVRCLAHCIYWPLYIAMCALWILAIVGIAVGFCFFAYNACASLWKDHTSAAWVVVTVVLGGLLIGGYEWSKRKLGKDT